MLHCDCRLVGGVGVGGLALVAHVGHEAEAWVGGVGGRLDPAVGQRDHKLALHVTLTHIHRSAGTGARGNYPFEHDGIFLLILTLESWLSVFWKLAFE